MKEFVTVWDTSYESDNNVTNSNRIKTTDLFMREKLEFSASGYIYHPRFILFLTKVAAGVKHESFSNEFETQRFNTLFADEYEFRVLVLPRHPYHLLNCIPSRFEPLTKMTFSGQAHATAYSKGAIFRYKKKPYFFNAHYTEDSTDAGTGSNTVKRYGMIGTYYKELTGERYYSVAAAYDHANLTDRDFIGLSDEASLSGSFASRTLGLSSGVIVSRSDQRFSDTGMSTNTRNFFLE